MLNFSYWLRKDVGRYYEHSEFDLNKYSVRYLLALHKIGKIYLMKDEFWFGCVRSLGPDGLIAAGEHVRRWFLKHKRDGIDEKREKSVINKIEAVFNVRGKNAKLRLFDRWVMLREFMSGKFWNDSLKDETITINDVFHVVLRHASFKLSQSEKTVFDKRLDNLCRILGLSKVQRDIITLIFFVEHSESLYNLMDGLDTYRRTKYSNMCKLLNYPEDEILKAFSGERSLTALGVINGYDGSFNISEEFLTYLRGVGTENLIDIFASADKNKPLELEMFDMRKEAELIIDLIKIHKNERPLNFFLYGMEGTGKTELARTIAANSGRELLDVGSVFLRVNTDSVGNSIAKFRMTSLVIADFVLRTDNKLVLLLDEADVLFSNFEKGVINRVMENTRLPVIWITNSLHSVQRSTMRRFEYSIEFKSNTVSMRQKLWNHVVDKHKASDLFSQERILKLSEKYDVVPGGMEKAVFNEVNLSNQGKKRDVAEMVLKQHVGLLGDSHTTKPQTRAPKYDETVLNVPGMDKAVYAAKCYARLLRNNDTESNCTMLLYGPPGTGKTEFARYLARESELPFKEISYGKISSMYVGETEKQLAEAFEKASEDGSLLFIDEADSLLYDRRNAVRSWETTQVNEFLVQLENSKCLVVCSTNFQGKLDAASNRRFHFHLRFDYLKKEGILKMARNFFPELEHENWDRLCREECLAPGDFYAVYKRLQWLPKNELNADLVIKELSEVANGKEAFGNRRIGFN